MTIRIIEQPDVSISQSDYNRYAEEYRRAYAMYCGTPPTLEDYIRRRVREEEDWKRSSSFAGKVKRNALV